MHGHGYTQPVKQPPSPGYLVSMRVLFVTLSVLTCGFLTWVMLLRLAVVTRRSVDWGLFVAVLAVDILSIVLIGTEPGDEIHTPGGYTGLALLLITLVAVIAYYIAADVRHFQQQRYGGYAPTPTPGYGYPQPQYPGGPGTPPPGGPGSRNPFKGKPALVVGAAVAALLVIGGSVWAVTANGGDDKDKKPVAGKSDDPKPSGSGGDAPVNPGDGSGDGGEDPDNLNEGRQAGESKVLWYKEAPDAPGSGADANGMWITDKTAVKAAYKQVFAYNVGDGKPSWDPIAFPEKICAVTPEKTADDKIVVAYMSGSSDRAKCNKLQEIDLATGAKGWTEEVADGELFDSTLSVELSVSGTTLMVGRSQSGTAYDVTSGKKLYDKKRYGDACFPAGFAGSAKKLVQVASCGAGGNTEHDEVQGLDPKTGKVLWTYKYDKGWRVARAYSVDPLVVYATNEDKKVWNISTFTSGGKVLEQVGVDEDFAPECGWAILERDLQGCSGVAVAAGTLYLPTEATSGANEIVAINLATGKEKWRTKSPADESMMPLKVEGDQLVAYVQPSYDAGGQVVAIPTGGSAHAPAKLLQNPQGVADIENSFYSKDVDWVDGRFYISTTRLTGNDESKEKLMLAYGK
ncbi:PQQ-like beta-propeller repeat protein [Streptomyces sp. WAC 04229]|uniref:PQQ-like beta-propeller repeat protein n=1 Tax=Streptomyces sp. WAC 04229 TaxID=2203206 RepID=UPI0021AD9666|nr:PQQ-like beta-propeller repeat protein [Streptomyces sp. WAC 04229]